MTENEKIAYAKSFIDMMANGINPLNGNPIPEEELINNIRISRCLFFVSDVLRRVVDNGIAQKSNKSKKTKAEKLPFSITAEQLEKFEASEIPISTSALASKINFLIDDVREKRMKKLKYKHISQFLVDIGMTEWREWGEATRCFPTAEGEAIGLVLKIFENYGRSAPVIYYTAEAQRFVVDHMEIITSIANDEGIVDVSSEDECVNDTE